MSQYEKGYADGFNARKIIQMVMLNGIYHCGCCGKSLGKYKAKEYHFCPYCGVRLV